MGRQNHHHHRHRQRQRQLEASPPPNTATGITTKRISAGGNQLAVEEGEYSGKSSCQSCTARAIADCVAVCCCPCAVVNFFTLTFLKVPWMMGRKCLANNKKKKKKKKLKDVEVERKDDQEDENGGELGKSTAIEEEEGEEGNRKYSARFEAEKVWLELYRVDNLGFGRVSFNGIQSLG